MIYLLPGDLNFANIRHAHSHLMFFNWICPPVMAWMAVTVLKGNRSENVRVRPFKICLYVMLFLGFLSYPFFLLYGYRPVPIGGGAPPLAAIISGLVMLTWYWFTWLYYRERQKAGDTTSLTFFDGALLALVISSLGAWGVSLFQFTAIDSPLISSAMTHFFLAVFTEGWAVLGILGIMWSVSGADKPGIYINWLWMPLLFGSMLIFPFSLSQTMVTTTMLITAKTGFVLIGISMVLNLHYFFRMEALSGFIWRTVLALLGLKILFQLATLLPLDIWPGEHGLRVLYLHVLLLGAVSLVLIEGFRPHAAKAAKYLFVSAVLLVIVTLLMISGYWPQEYALPNTYFWVMVISILPVLPAAWLWMSGFKR